MPASCIKGISWEYVLPKQFGLCLTADSKSDDFSETCLKYMCLYSRVKTRVLFFLSPLMFFKNLAPFFFSRIKWYSTGHVRLQRLKLTTLFSVFSERKASLQIKKVYRHLFHFLAVGYEVKLPVNLQKHNQHETLNNWCILCIVLYYTIVHFNNISVCRQEKKSILWYKVSSTCMQWLVP